MLVLEVRWENAPPGSISLSSTTLDFASDAGMHDPTAAGTEPRRNSRPTRSDSRQSNGRLLPQSAAVGTVRIDSSGGKIGQCGVPFQRPSDLRWLKIRAIARIRQFDRRAAGPDSNHLQREQPGHERKTPHHQSDHCVSTAGAKFIRFAPSRHERLPIKEEMSGRKANF